MPQLPHALERIRAAFRRRIPGGPGEPATPQVAPPARPERLTPDVWDARLVVVRRRRRERHAPPAQVPQPPAAWERTEVLVRLPYAAALGGAPGNDRAAAHADPWGATS
ncbi:hypothetical protein OG352_22480 [Streptomyces sp. NBC_01485]|uniref:hypothetical protein n=1 Tax=Streptomyces sp. NBC_01485 TaxID=2903884 RepID=UPI002E343D1B|nr:hypothetical protein [Streptomyces sp. NBC_01485]